MAGSEYFDHTIYPAQGAPGSSAAMRAEFDRVEDGFGKLPPLSGNAGKIAIIKADASGMEAITTVGVAGAVVLASGVLSAGVPATDKAVLAAATTGTGDVVRANDPTFILTDTVTNNASTSQHGWMRKLPGGAGVFYNGAGNFVAPPSQSLIPDSRTSNTILGAADQGHLVKVTSGTFTQTITAAATLGSGWFVWYQNAGTGDITIDPNGAETINGASTLLMQTGAVYVIGSDGTNLFAVLVTPATGYMKVSDQKASGTAGGTSVATDITQTRTLNTTEINTINGASLAANAVTLPAGTYMIRGQAPSRAGRNKLFLYNSTDSTYAAIGSNSAASDSYSEFFTQITLTTAKTFTMRHWTLSATASEGLGATIATGQLEIYAQLEINKVA